MNAAHRPLTHCPVCHGDLVTTRLGCPSCGTEIAGQFSSCSYCALDDADLDLLRVFLSSRGNMREVEKHLGVSYPTARARFGALLARLGLAGADADAPGGPEETTGVSTSSTGGGEGVSTGSTGGGEGVSAGSTGGAGGVDAVRDQVLARVASGELPPDVAADLLARLG